MNELYWILSFVILLAGFSMVIWMLMRKKRHEEGAELLHAREQFETLNRETATLRHQMEEMTSGRKVAEEKNLWMEKQVRDIAHEKELLEDRLNKSNTTLASREADLEALNEKLQSHQKELEKIREQFNLEFRNLANEILEEKTKKFTEQNKIRLEELLKPLGEKIRDFEKKVEETYDKESKERFSLAREIKNLANLNQQISKEASNLTQALKGQAKTQGNWGEIILESILEKSGLQRDREYFVQPSYTTSQGKRLQPDVVVHYPGDRHVVIDSKVSLTAYERFVSAETKDDQERALQDHLLSMRNHIQELQGKNYQDLYQLKSLDFIMMFMPVEPAYLVAMQGDPGLWNYAYDRRVLLISPTNLIAALRMIANLWRVEYQNKNAEEIARQSGDMLDKFTNFVNDLIDIGTKIESTQKSYDAAMNKLSSGKGNLVRRAEKIRELGAKASKELPSKITDETNP